MSDPRVCSSAEHLLQGHQEFNMVPTERMNEREIIRAVVEGDTEAYAELVLAHQARVRLICLTYRGRRR